MKNFLTLLGLRGRLAAMAIVFGALAIVAGDPYTGAHASVDTRQLALDVFEEKDHTSTEQLAGWIIEGRNDFRLLDVRTEQEYAAYHIPGAELVTIAGLAEYPLRRNEKIVLYSEEGIHAAQAWFLLRAKEFSGTTILRGGLGGWKATILFPRLPDGAGAEEKAAFERKKLVSAFFGGSASVGGTASATPSVEMPKLAMPVPKSPAAQQSGAKKKKEGC